VTSTALRFGHRERRDRADIRAVDLLIPVKPLLQAKSRLRQVTADNDRSRERHIELVLALITDTLEAALAASVLRRVVVVTGDRAVARLASTMGAEVLGDEPPGGLNAALRYGAFVLRKQSNGTVVGALQADLPALVPEELSAAVISAAGRRAFHEDRGGDGTTLLLGGAGGDLRPHFGEGSARAHEQSGALRLNGDWPSLACDVDCEEDLRAAASLGLGAATGRLTGTSAGSSDAG